MLLDIRNVCVNSAQYMTNILLGFFLRGKGGLGDCVGFFLFGGGVVGRGVLRTKPSQPTLKVSDW